MVINVLSTLGPVGWVYAGLDLGVSFFNNGEGITDIIVKNIDNMTGGTSLDINPME